MAVALETDQAPVNPPVAPVQKTADCSIVRTLDWDYRIAYAICMAESRGKASIDNAGLNTDGSTDYGLMQINSIHADMVGGDLEALRDPAINIKVAYSLSKGGTDWTPWSAYNNGSYKKWL